MHAATAKRKAGRGGGRGGGRKRKEKKREEMTLYIHAWGGE
jgi:hypothetical protein